MKPRSSDHWTWRLFRWCQMWQSPRRLYWFRRLKLDRLWTQLDPYGYGISIFRNGDEIIWLFPSVRPKFHGKKWYNVNLGESYASLAEIDKFWEEYSAASRAAALREEASREDFYF